jgi:ArsR family transcriptional regulator
MRTFLASTKALNDRTRLRTLLALRRGELCLCQLVELFGLAPSTMSKHLNILYDAGLIDRRRDGRWAFFRLAGRDAPAVAKRAIRWVTTSLADDPDVISDEQKLTAVLRADLEQLCECYS